MTTDAMWVTASTDQEALDTDRRLALAKIACAEVWPVLAAAGSEQEFALRQEMVADTITARIAAVVGEGLVEAVLPEVLASQAEDWKTHHAAVTAAQDAEQAALDAVTSALGKDAEIATGTEGEQSVPFVREAIQVEARKVKCNSCGTEMTDTSKDGLRRCRKCKSTDLKNLGSIQVEAVAWGRRHYEDLASVISSLPEGEREHAANHFATALAGSNPHYRPQQFRDAASSENYRVRGGTGNANYSRGHYQHIADAIKTYPGDRQALASKFADHFAATNPRFDRDRFGKATSVQADMALAAHLDGPLQHGDQVSYKGEGAEVDQVLDGGKVVIRMHNSEDTMTVDQDSLTSTSVLQTEAEYKYVHKRGDKWVITQKGTGKVLSTHDSQDQAEASFRAMMQSKHGHIAPTFDPTDEKDEFRKWVNNEFGESPEAHYRRHASMIVEAMHMPCPACTGRPKSWKKNCYVCGGDGKASASAGHQYLQDRQDFMDHWVGGNMTDKAPAVASLVSFADITDDDILEVEALLETEGLSFLRPFRAPTPEEAAAESAARQQRYENHENSPEQQARRQRETEHYQRQDQRNNHGIFASKAPASVHDHKAEPEWDTSTASDLCKICGWPVEKNGGSWAHEDKNPVEWSDKRKAASIQRVACRKCIAGKDIRGGECDYCDGIGTLSATEAMLKQADGWGQGLTAEAFLTEAATHNCKHCGRHIVRDDDGRWVDPEATGDDSIWRETCDENHEDRMAEHEPDVPTRADMRDKLGVNTDADGSDRYQRTPHPVKPGWVEDDLEGQNFTPGENPMTPQAERPAGRRAIERNKRQFEQDLVPTWDQTGDGRATAGLQTHANPYNPDTNPYSTSGPGNPESGVRAPGGENGGMGEPEPGMPTTQPMTTRPRVKPSSTDPMTTELDQTYMGNPDEAPGMGTTQRTAPAAGDAASTFARLRESRAQWTEPPTLAARVALKADEIAAGVMATNPGMDAYTAAQVAVETISRYPAVLAAAAWQPPHLPVHPDHAHPVPDMNSALEDYMNRFRQSRRPVTVVEQ